MAEITKAMIKKHQTPRIKIEMLGMELYGDEIASGSFSYKCGVGSGAFAPGGCVISSVSVTLIDHVGFYFGTIPEGEEIKVYIGYGRTDKDATYKLLATVYAAEVSYGAGTATIRAYDKLRQADKRKWLSVGPWPMTVNQIITAAAGDAGIDIDTLPAAGGDIEVDLRDDEGKDPEINLTCRQAMAAALLISGNWAHVTADGSLYCGWYGDKPAEEYEIDWIMGYSLTDALDYTGVQVYGQEVTGSAKRLYKLSSAQFLNAKNAAAVQARLADAMIGLPVSASSFSCVLNPNIKPGMMLTVTYPKVGTTETIEMPVTSVSINGTMVAEYACEAITADKADDLRKSSDEILEDAANNGMGGGGSGGGISSGEVGNMIDDALNGNTHGGPYATEEWVNGLIGNIPGAGDSPMHGYFRGYGPKKACTIYGQRIASGGTTDMNNTAATITIKNTMLVIPRYTRMQACIDKANAAGGTSTPVEMNMYFELRFNATLYLGSDTFTVLLSCPTCLMVNNPTGTKGASITTGTCLMYGTKPGTSEVITGRIGGLPKYLISRDEIDKVGSLWDFSDKL